MKYFNSLSAVTRILLICTAVFIGYGYLCRVAGINFFWESLSIGWVLFWVLLISFFVDSIRKKKKLNKVRVGEKIGIGFCVFIILIKAVLFFAVPHSDAYTKAIAFIQNDSSIQKETGRVKDIFLKPVGNISVGDEEGKADLYFIIKGEKKYLELNLELVKRPGTDWNIVKSR